MNDQSSFVLFWCWSDDIAVVDWISKTLLSFGHLLLFWFGRNRAEAFGSMLAILLARVELEQVVHTSRH
ncbi:hypothetical protein D5086_005893 [Populus alba]|uniref:Uncharacterized protein n=1 Tax=Populus alba TaxID=43335 RepID=A0ACC4CUH1_POPAL